MACGTNLSPLGYLFQALSYFSFICWIKPRNNLINTLFGVGTGMGLSMLTFDWSQISWVGSPLTNPWFAQTSAFFGFILFYWIINPILHFSNVSTRGYHESTEYKHTMC